MGIPAENRKIHREKAKSGGESVRIRRLHCINFQNFPHMKRTAYAARVRTMVRLWVFHMLLISLQPGQPQQDLLQHRGIQLIEYEFSPAVIPDQVRPLQHR